MMKPLISINISCLNRSEMLKECITSFINQTFTDWELILVDDGSTEDLTFVEKMDERVHYYRQEHAGMARGLNLALSKSSGDYIMPFGSDDLATSRNLLGATLIALEEHPNHDVIYTDCWIQHPDGSRIRKKHAEYVCPDEAYRRMLKRQYISHGGILFKKDKYPQYDETVSSAEDLEFFLTAMENGVRFKLLPWRLWTYRVGHEREGGTRRQNEGCDRVLKKRGYHFNKDTRKGEKI